MPHQNDDRKWTPSEKDALHLATLRLYALQTERLYTAIYFSDPDPARPTMIKLKRVIQDHLAELHDLALTMQSKGSECPDDFVFCPDGLCHPPGTCS